MTIWEEKNSTELEKNCLNNNELEQNDIIKNINNDCVKNECLDTIKKWMRSCPDCGKTITYKQKKYYSGAIKNNSKCESCCIKGKKIAYKPRLSMKGKLHPRYGKTHSEESKKKMSMKLKGRKLTTEHIEKRTISQKGRFVSDEVRKNMRIGAIKRIEKLKFYGGRVTPGFNETACKYFDELNKQNGWNLKHALNGGEFYIKELGYWVDAYDKEKNIVFEYDEPYHDREKQKQKDLRRLCEIKKHLKCRFLRYNHSNGIITEY